MKVTKVSVSFGRTVSPRNYSPVRTEMFIEAELGPKDDEQEVRIKLFKRLKKDIDKISEGILERESEN